MNEADEMPAVAFVRMTVVMHEALKQRAADEDRTMAQVVRRALQSYFATEPS